MNLGIDQGEDLPLPFLSELYHHILENEIKMEGEETFPNALKRGPFFSLSQFFLFPLFYFFLFRAHFSG